MGFLSGAYGKLMAGQHLRNLQHRLTQVTSRHRRITREIEQKEKYYQNMERNMKQALMSESRNRILGNLAGYLGKEQFASLNINDPASVARVFGGMTQDQLSGWSTYQQSQQYTYTQSQTMYANLLEMQKEADLEALKDVEDDLQTEKENLESQIKLAQADYDAKKEEEKAGAKTIAPDYTGQG